MLQKKAPFILIIASVVLILINIATTDDYGNAFWMQTLSGILLILAMGFTIRDRNKSKK
ncbi:MAG: hypothetical protein WA775_11520 [Psychroserpens sp.]|uniref:hypothetical protein n=1 Tax=Psychroserpens sp. TaxID=2020870 RepID=UPI003C786715